MRERWSKATVILHWLAATLLVVNVLIGVSASGLAADASHRLVLSRLHAIGGAALMLLMVGRLVARRSSPTIAPLPVSPAHRKGIAAVHGALYAVTFAVGASGLLTAAKGAWLEYLRGSVRRAPELASSSWRGFHQALVFVLVGLVTAHVIGVIVEQLRRGRVLRRMAPFSR